MLAEVRACSRDVQVDGTLSRMDVRVTESPSKVFTSETAMLPVRTADR